jgi:hypothetical protein
MFTDLKTFSFHSYPVFLGIEVLDSIGGSFPGIASASTILEYPRLPSKRFLVKAAGYETSA